MTVRVSAVERLQALPPVFRGADLTVRFRWTSKTASQYVYLWKRRGLIEALGGKSDVFANLLKPDRVDWHQAVRMAIPSAVIVGVEALRAAGWTTQVPQRPVAAVRAGDPVFKIRRFVISRRSDDWFRSVREGIARGEPHGAAPLLEPAWALADLLRGAGWGSGGLRPDDIAWELLSPDDMARVLAAAAALDVPDDAIETIRAYANDQGRREPVASGSGSR